MPNSAEAKITEILYENMGQWGKQIRKLQVLMIQAIRKMFQTKYPALDLTIDEAEMELLVAEMANPMKLFKEFIVNLIEQQEGSLVEEFGIISRECDCMVEIQQRTNSVLTDKFASYASQTSALIKVLLDNRGVEGITTDLLFSAAEETGGH